MLLEELEEPEAVVGEEPVATVELFPAVGATELVEPVELVAAVLEVDDPGDVIRGLDVAAPDEVELDDPATDDDGVEVQDTAVGMVETPADLQRLSA